MNWLTCLDRIVRRVVPSVWLDRISGYDVFVSYSQRDGGSYAESIVTFARRQGLTVFRDNDGIRDGEDIPDRIIGALNRAKLLLVLATPQAVESKEVRKERELYRKRKTLFRAERPIAVVYPGDDISIDFEGIKAISTDGTVEGVTEASLTAIKDQVGWYTSLRRLYAGLLAVAMATTVAVVLLVWSLSVSKTETIAQRWEAIAQAAEKDHRYSEAESAYRNGSNYAVRLVHEASRMRTYRHLVPASRVPKSPDSECRFATQLDDGRILTVFWFSNPSRASIRIDGQEVSVLEPESETRVDCDWVQNFDQNWTLAISNGEQLWIVESAGGALPKTTVAFNQPHACFCLMSDGSVQTMTLEGDSVTVHRLNTGERLKETFYRPGRNLVSEHRSHVTTTSVLCGAFSSSIPREAFVAVAASPQSAPNRTCQIDVFRLVTDENDFELVASLPLQSITGSANPLGIDAMAEPYDDPLTSEGGVDFATGLSVSTDQAAVAFQFVQGENFMVGKPFHVVMPADDFSQNATRGWQATHEVARRRIHIDGNAVTSIALVDNPFPAAVVHRNEVVQFIRLGEPPSSAASMTTDSKHCTPTSLLGIRSPVLLNATSESLETFKGEHRVCYSLPVLPKDVLAIHGGRSSLIVIESPDSLFCFEGWSESATIDNEGASERADQNGYVVDVEGLVRIPAFE